MKRFTWMSVLVVAVLIGSATFYPEHTGVAVAAKKAPKKKAAKKRARRPPIVNCMRACREQLQIDLEICEPGEIACIHASLIAFDICRDACRQ